MRHQSLKLRLTASLHRKAIPTILNEVEHRKSPSLELGARKNTHDDTEGAKSGGSSSVEGIEEFPKTNEMNMTLPVSATNLSPPCLTKTIPPVPSLRGQKMSHIKPPPSGHTDQRAAAIKLIQHLPRAKVLGLEILGLHEFPHGSCLNAKYNHNPKLQTPYNNTPDIPVDDETILSSVNASVAEEKLRQKKGTKPKSCLKQSTAMGARVNKSVCFRGNRLDKGSEVTTICLYEYTHVPLPWPPKPVLIKKGDHNMQGLLSANYNQRIGVNFLPMKLMS